MKIKVDERLLVFLPSYKKLWFGTIRRKAMSPMRYCRMRFAKLCYIAGTQSGARGGRADASCRNGYVP